MKAVVLGAAAGGGFPQWNCACPVCTLAWTGDARVRAATQSSLAVSADGASWTLFNASPDILTQIARTPELQPFEDGRNSPIRAVVLTNADIDHIAGLLSLREGHRFEIFALPPVLAAIRANPVFSALSAAAFIEAVPDEAFTVTELSCTLFPVPGKVPLYQEGARVDVGSQKGETAGIAVGDGAHTLLYVPGCAHLTPPLEARLAAADAVLFDGTLFTDDEMVRAGLGAKTGRRMGHMPISGEGGSLDFLAGLKAAQKIYVHINNTNPIWISGSPERRAVEDRGVAVGYDGMEIVL